MSNVWKFEAITGPRHPSGARAEAVDAADAQADPAARRLDLPKARPAAGGPERATVRQPGGEPSLDATGSSG